MRHFTRSAVVALALILPALSVASASHQLPSLTLVSQEFISPSSPASFDEALQGSLKLEFSASWNWPNVGLDISMNHAAYYFGKAGNHVWISDTYPADLSLPEFIQQDELLTVTIPKINVLTHDSFSAAARVASPPSAQFGPWNRFPNAVVPSVTINDTLMLKQVLSPPPADRELQHWIQAMLEETLVKAGPSGRGTIGVEFMYPIDSQEIHYVVVPVLLATDVAYSAEVSVELAKNINNWIGENQPPMKNAALSFDLTLFSEFEGQLVPKARFNDLRIELDAKVLVSSSSTERVE